MRIKVVISVGIALLTAGGCQTTDSTGVVATPVASCLEEAPLPSDLSVLSVPADVPADYARFSGKWHGKWEDVLCHILVVTSVHKDGTVKAVYSWGRYSGWNIDEPGSKFRRGRIVDDKLNLDRFQNGAQAVYWFEGEDLVGTYTNRKGGVSYITLAKVE